jgi:hypothetical protein
MMIHIDPFSFGHVCKPQKLQAQKIKIEFKNSNLRVLRTLLCVEFLFAFRARA